MSECLAAKDTRIAVDCTDKAVAIWQVARMIYRKPVLTTVDTQKRPPFARASSSPVQTSYLVAVLRLLDELVTLPATGIPQQR
jgi:hypothetical protein